MNVKNHHIYRDKFKLSVIDLSHIELATEEDKANGIDYWASLFKAKTWEEIKMLAENNEYLQEAADSLYVANAEEIVRQQCRAREDAERHERTVKRDMRILREKLDKAQAENEERKANEAKLQTKQVELELRMKQLEDIILQLQKKN